MAKPLFEGGSGSLILEVILPAHFELQRFTDKEHRGTFVSHDQKLSPASRSSAPTRRTAVPRWRRAKNDHSITVNDAEWPIACVARVC